MLVENNIDSDEVIEFELDKNMFCWGSTIHGELGLGGIEEEHVLSPREVDFKKATDIEDSKFIFFKQTVFCFKNANEQFKQQNLYQIATNLDFNIFSVACGESHTIVVTRDGQVYSCGNNDSGQLGHNQSRKKLGKSEGI